MVWIDLQYEIQEEFEDVSAEAKQDLYKCLAEWSSWKRKQNYTPVEIIPTERLCLECKTPFQTHTTSHSKYCSNSCGDKFRKRKWRLNNDEWGKIKADPIKLAEFRKQYREWTKKNLEAIKTDPVRLRAYQELRKEKAKTDWDKTKADPIKLEKHRKSFCDWKRKKKQCPSILQTNLD